MSSSEASFFVSDPCPIDNPNYASIEGVCYFLQSVKWSHMKAKTECNSQTVNGVKGRLFEPRSLSTNDLVFSKFVSVHGNQNIHIGIDDLDQQNKWVYSTSKEVATFSNWEKGQPNAGSAHCVHFWNAHPKLWGDIGCNDNLASICEFRSGKIFQIESCHCRIKLLHNQLHTGKHPT